MGKVRLTSTASGSNPIFENDEMHVTGSFCSRLWGRWEGNLSLSAGIFLLLSLFLLDLTLVRTHSTLQSLSSLSCDLARAQAAPAVAPKRKSNTAVAPKRKCVCSDLMLNRRGDCPVWGTSVFPEEQSEIALMPPRPQLWGRVFLVFPGLKTSPAMSSEGICPCLCMGSCFGKALRTL